jgi:hypothetical protein
MEEVKVGKKTLSSPFIAANGKRASSSIRKNHFSRMHRAPMLCCITALSAFHDFLGWRPDQPQIPPGGTPPEPVSASREDKCVTLTVLYKLAILLSNKCHNVGGLIRPDQVPDLGYADEEDSHGRSDRLLVSSVYLLSAKLS